jgi:predicted permease
MRRVFRIPFSRTHIPREVDDELSFHLEMRTQRLVAEGWTHDAARNEARRQFGDVDTVRQDCVALDEQRERATQRADILGDLRQDASYAFRTLRRNIGFTSVIVGALALGIGANTAIFTLIDAVVVRTLPVRHPEQLVAIGDAGNPGSNGRGTPLTELLSYPLYRDVQLQNHSFVDMLASGPASRLDARIETASEELEHPRARFVSGNFFTVLGVPAFVGRTFDASADAIAGASPVTTISYGYWTRRFHRDPSVVGRTMLVNGVKLTIVGVTPPSFTGDVVGEEMDLWLPLGMRDVLRPNNKVLDDRHASWLLLLGRLKPGVTLAQARGEVSTLLKQNILANASPRTAQAFLARHAKYLVEPGANGFSEVRRTYEAPLVTLMIGVVLLLAIICANVANLLLARAIARGREMAVRLALGADRSRLVRQLLTESALLALESAGLGLLVAWLGSRALLTMAADGNPVWVNLGMDGSVLAFTLIVSVVAVGLFGVVPALHASRIDLASAMRGTASSIAGGIGARGGRLPLGKALIAGQVGLSVVLLVGAAMLVRSLRNVQNVDVGMDRDHLVIVDLDIDARGYQGQQLASVVHAMRERVAAVPGISAVTFSENGIFSGTEWHTSVQVAGFVPKSPDDSMVATDMIGPGYVDAIGGKLIAGRGIVASDESTLPRVALVNESLASFYFPGQNAVGRFLRFEDTVAVQIVGVMADVRDHELTEKPARRAYFSYVHADDPKNAGSPGSLRLEVRSTGDPSSIVQSVRRAALAVDPSLPIDKIEPLTTLMRRSISDERLVTQLATAFGVLALLLAAVGLYGVMTYAITRRTAEIGLRVALGAQRGDIGRMVLLDALRVVAIGVVVGLPAALGSMRLLTSQLHGVEPGDPLSIVVAISVLAVSAIVAVLLPAVRAARVSPIVALRAE